MKKHIKGILIGIAITTAIQGTLVYASTGKSVVDIFYNNIKIFLNGNQITSKDPSGKIIEPFTMNGTVYFPVESIAEAFGKEVTWDGDTQSMHIGEKQSIDLDQMGSYRFESLSGRSTYGSSADNYNLNYGVPNADFSRGIRYTIKGGRNTNDTLVSPEIVTDEYLVNKEYSRFTGSFYCRHENGGDMSILKIYGDNKLLYTSPSMADASSVPAYFNIDIKDVSILKLEFSTWDDSQISKTLVIGEGKLLK